MGKGREVFTFEQKCNLSKKTKSTNFGSHTSSDRENSEIAFDSNSDILKYDNHRKNNNNKVYSYSKRFITILRLTGSSNFGEASLHFLGLLLHSFKNRKSIISSNCVRNNIDVIRPSQRSCEEIFVEARKHYYQNE
ncbi:hypothetical protein POVCU2_0051730 [Plasmodium ovale curtisi]|uniref:Uncharacterized protein n=1 Tax=Plasmodium ovale curtisi TaxID=864141 RepID=A0A1A8WAK2_PLAOA|nr:hypothetical protein POVCU2_0051730 [Plasmodium ovale curtisi]SBS98706.1 hypothetical protein POVCU1_048160 [Plasmodium ovale curtisi]